MQCRVLKKKKCDITQQYGNKHTGVDITGYHRTLDYIIAHSDGKIILIQDNLGNLKGSTGTKAYGNYVKIEHQNGYYTVYAHMDKNLPVKKNQYVKKGDVLGYMSDSGNSYGKHLHFEVWYKNKKINPEPYLNNDLPSSTTTVEIKYKVGDIVNINGIYISSTSKKKLNPLVTSGKITDIIENANNPYLLDNGKLGWVNDNTIISKEGEQYLSNKNYKGNSIIDALKQIKVDSSYSYRSKLAKLNGIKNYKGTAEQNTKLLNLLKEGKLKY